MSGDLMADKHLGFTRCVPRRGSFIVQCTVSHLREFQITFSDPNATKRSTRDSTLRFPIQFSFTLVHRSRRRKIIQPIADEKYTRKKVYIPFIRGPNVDLIFSRYGILKLNSERIDRNIQFSYNYLL